MEQNIATTGAPGHSPQLAVPCLHLEDRFADGFFGNGLLCRREARARPIGVVHSMPAEEDDLHRLIL